MNRYDDARRVFDTVSQLLVEVRLIVDVPSMAGLSLTTANLDGLPVIGLRESPHFGLNVIVKRIMDFLISSLALVILSPLLMFIAVLVKATSRGPIFFRQERCGLNGQSFAMLKFRTLRVDAEKETGPVWTAKNDVRRTHIGAFLRKTSLDELPQFINVLLGDMSRRSARDLTTRFASASSKKRAQLHGPAQRQGAASQAGPRSTAGAATRPCASAFSSTYTISRTGTPRSICGSCGSRCGKSFFIGMRTDRQGSLGNETAGTASCRCWPHRLRPPAAPLCLRDAPLDTSRELEASGNRSWL